MKLSSLTKNCSLIYLCMLLLCFLAISPTSAVNNTCYGRGMLTLGENLLYTSGRWFTLQNFTFEIWMLFQAENVSYSSYPIQGIISAFHVRGPNSCDIDGWGIFRYSNTLRVVFGGILCDDNSFHINFQNGVWHHIAVVVSGQNLKMYLDGDLYEVKPKNVSVNYPANLNKLIIGSDPDGKYKLVGQMDEIRFWNTSRSDEQIKDYRNIGFQNSTYDPTLLLYIPFDSVNQSSLMDFSRNQRNITLSASNLNYKINCDIDYCACGKARCAPQTNIHGGICDDSNSAQFIHSSILFLAILIFLLFI